MFHWFVTVLVAAIYQFVGLPSYLKHCCNVLNLAICRLAFLIKAFLQYMTILAICWLARLVKPPCNMVSWFLDLCLLLGSLAGSIVVIRGVTFLTSSSLAFLSLSAGFHALLFGNNLPNCLLSCPLTCSFLFSFFACILALLICSILPLCLLCLLLLHFRLSKNVSAGFFPFLLTLFLSCCALVFLILLLQAILQNLLACFSFTFRMYSCLMLPCFVGFYLLVFCPSASLLFCILVCKYSYSLLVGYVLFLLSPFFLALLSPYPASMVVSFWQFACLPSFPFSYMFWFSFFAWFLAYLLVWMLVICYIAFHSYLSDCFLHFL